MGNESLFDSYVNRTVKNTYDREHVLLDKYEDYAASFSSREEFNSFRWKLGNLILLKLDKNRSYQDMTYFDKKDLYLTNNIIAQSFNALCYKNNPKFMSFIKTHGYNFKAYDTFDKHGINERQEVYQAMAYDIWDEGNLQAISGEWDKAMEDEIMEAKIANSTTVDLVTGNISTLTKKTPIAIQFEDKQYGCRYYTQMVTTVIKLLNDIDHDKLVKLAKEGYRGRIIFSTSPDIQGNPSSKWVMAGVENIYADVHGSGEEHGNFVKSLLDEFGVSSCRIYLK